VIFCKLALGFKIDLRVEWESDEASNGLPVLEGGWLECNRSVTFGPVENPTCLRLLEVEEPGKDARDSGVFVALLGELNAAFLRRDEVEGGLRGRISGIDMV
jgi:hypothetical protein